MDKLTTEQRHSNMAAIRSKDTKPEMIVRRGLWKRGFRYRLNHKRLPGHPDLVLRKYRTCIFINGCFWHGHNVSLTPDPSLTPNPSPKGEGDSKGEGSEYIVNSECCKIPKTNREFWVAKIRRSSGWRRFAETKNVTRRNNASWLKWAGIASRFGNAS